MWHEGSMTKDQTTLFGAEASTAAITEQAHLSKLIDVPMRVVQNGRQRTQAELARLLRRAGWRVDSGGRPDNRR